MVARSGFPEVTKTVGRTLEVIGPNSRSRIPSYNPTLTWASAGGHRTNAGLLALETQTRKQGQGCRRCGLVVGPFLGTPAQLPRSPHPGSSKKTSFSSSPPPLESVNIQ